MADVNEIVNNLMLELRRGTLVLSVLSQLNGPQYGYSLVQSLEKKGINIDAGTLYPLLRRLEKQELLESKWEVTDSRPRRYYYLSSTGKEVYSKLCSEWGTMVKSINKLLNLNGGIGNGDN
jgi:PadR family transcriptional regulator, regulatory protein PadR